jgi:hypothetical protein
MQISCANYWEKFIYIASEKGVCEVFKKKNILKYDNMLSDNVMLSDKTLSYNNW